MEFSKPYTRKLINQCLGLLPLQCRNSTDQSVSLPAKFCTDATQAHLIGIQLVVKFKVPALIGLVKHLLSGFP